MVKPLVSIMLITYNQEHFITDAIESFLMQKCSFPFEIVIGDDASSDNTQKIIKDYYSRFPLIIKPILNPMNLGPLRNAINVLEQCAGKYIALCEGDDYWTDPDKLQIQIDFLENNSDYVLSYHNVIAINVSDDKRTRNEIQQEIYRKDPKEIPVGHPTHTSSMVFRNVIRTYPTDIDKIISGDSYLQFVLARFGKSTFQREIYPNIRRRHPQSIWSYKTQEYKIEQGIILYEKLLEIAISKEEIEYLNRLLIKSRIIYYYFLCSTHKKKESLTYFKKTLVAAWSKKKFWFFILFNLSQLPPAAGIYKYFKSTV
jgi:glycosyltransferase involved in cell wall biosynthesis